MLLSRLLRIDHRHLFKAKFPERYTYLILEMRDADDQNLIRIFPQSVATFPTRLSFGAVLPANN